MILFFILLIVFLFIGIVVSENFYGDPLVFILPPLVFVVSFLLLSDMVSNKEPISFSDPIYVEVSESGEIEIFQGKYVVYDSSSGIKEAKKFSEFTIVNDERPHIKELKFDKKSYWYRLNFTPQNREELYLPTDTKFKLIQNEKPDQ